MRTMSKLMRRALAAALTAFLLMGAFPLSARAEGETQIQILKLVTAESVTEAKEEPRDDAKTAMTYEAGSQIAVVGEENAAWYKVAYQGNIYYVKQDDTVEYEGPDPEEMNQQFEQEFIEGKILVEEIERQQKEARQTRIWGGVILVLVVAILGVGIYSHRTAKKDDEDSGEEKSDGQAQENSDGQAQEKSDGRAQENSDDRAQNKSE